MPRIVFQNLYSSQIHSDTATFCSLIHKRSPKITNFTWHDQIRRR